MGQAANSANAHALKDSVGKFIEASYRGAGVQVYGLSIHDGYHALTLTYGKNASGQEYHLIDNGPATSLFSGHRTFKTADELDEAINNYVRRDAVRKYRVGGEAGTGRCPRARTFMRYTHPASVSTAGEGVQPFHLPAEGGERLPGF